MMRERVKKLSREFFERKPEVVAKKLLGKFLVRKSDEGSQIGKIVETEAYLGLGDKASHSHKGKTKRNEVMFGPAGHAYVYFTYGMHWLLNIVTETDEPSAVLIRAVEPISGVSSTDLKGVSGAEKSRKPGSLDSARDDKQARRLGSGPARLTKWMGINGDQNGIDLIKSKELFIAESIGDFIAEEIKRDDIHASPRIGVDYAGEHKDLPLRFYIKNNHFVSKK